MRVAVPGLEIQPCVCRVRSHEHVLREFRVSRVAESDFGLEEKGGELVEGCSQCVASMALQVWGVLPSGSVHTCSECFQPSGSSFCSGMSPKENRWQACVAQ